MADAGHVQTDKILAELQKQIAHEYVQAAADMQKKLEAYLAKTEAQRQIQEGLLNAGKITKAEYSAWCYRHNMVGKQWEDMRDVLVRDICNANVIAKEIMHGKMPDVYALNANYETYEIEKKGHIDTGFTLYNHDTAEYLLGDQRQLMPAPSTKKAAQIAANKDMQWNAKKIQSCVLQGVLQGETPSQVASRLQTVGNMNYNAAVRYARTMTTSAQNAGRYQAIHRASKLGVDLIVEWQATLDHATRHEHRMMHGQRREVDEPFNTPDGYTIYYPADCRGVSSAPQSEIWNCRCTLVAWVKGHEGATVKDAPGMQGMSFDEWQNAKPYSNTAQDAAQYEAYKKTLGKAAPKTFADFQNTKYNDPASYAGMKAAVEAKKQQEKEAAKAAQQGTKINAKEYSASYHEKTNFNWKKWDALPQEEKDGVRKYTGSSYREMNRCLRNDTFDSMSKSTQEKVVNCTKALDKFTIADDTILYRGMGDTDSFAQALGISEREVQIAVNDGSINGMRFQEKGFCSAGVNHDAGWTKPVKLEIHAPKGTKGLYVDPISLMHGEEELLLQQGTIFEIQSATIDQWGGIDLTVNVVDQKPVYHTVTARDSAYW